MGCEYPTDLGWSNEEMILMIDSFNHIEEYYESGVTASDFVGAYEGFKRIVLAKAEERRIFNTFERNSGYDSYKVVQDIEIHSGEQRVATKK